LVQNKLAPKVSKMTDKKPPPLYCKGKGCGFQYLWIFNSNYKKLKPGPALMGDQIINYINPAQKTMY
jgi:hypothetical protein